MRLEYSTSTMRESVSQSDRQKKQKQDIRPGTYFVVAGTKKQANTLAFCALVDDVGHFIWVGVERQRGTHRGRRNGNLKRVPCTASICCTVVRSSTGKNECLGVCKLGKF